jgi:choline dehydrogenase-like flavoprotein
MMRRSFDIAVVGGGPAGTATAIPLSRIGYSVLVLEATSYQRLRSGETLPPTIAERLQRLGVFDLFLRQGYPPAAGIVSVWGKSQLQVNDFLTGCSPTRHPPLAQTFGQGRTWRAAHSGKVSAGGSKQETTAGNSAAIVDSWSMQQAVAGRHGYRTFQRGPSSTA